MKLIHAMHAASHDQRHALTQWFGVCLKVAFPGYSSAMHACTQRARCSGITMGSRACRDQAHPCACAHLFFFFFVCEFASANIHLNREVRFVTPHKAPSSSEGAPVKGLAGSHISLPFYAQADVSLSSSEGAPVMAHPPATESDLTLEHFLRLTGEHNAAHPDRAVGKWYLWQHSHSRPLTHTHSIRTHTRTHTRAHTRARTQPCQATEEFPSFKSHIHHLSLCRPSQWLALLNRLCTCTVTARNATGIKLDFKDPDAVEPSLILLAASPHWHNDGGYGGASLEEDSAGDSTSTSPCTPPVWLNADVLVGPGQKPTRFNPERFIRQCTAARPHDTLSLGWTVENRGPSEVR